LFVDLSAADLKIIAPLFSPRTHTNGSLIIRQGERATCIYLVTTGEVTLKFKPYDGDEIVVSRIRKGGVFGWSAVLGNKTYSASAVCTEDCEVLLARGDELRKLLKTHPQTGRVLMDALAMAVSKRWRDAQQQVKSMLRSGKTNLDTPTERKGGKMMNNRNISSAKEEHLKSLLEQVSAYIEQYHGGSVEFVAFDGETLQVRLGGACLGCPLSPSTLHGWVEGTVRQFFPEIRNVEAVD
jgi:CRP-like cAMP-binding protein